MRPVGSTPLQIAQQAIRAALLDAREDFDQVEYLVLLRFLVDVVAREAARCARWPLDPESDAWPLSG